MTLFGGNRSVSVRLDADIRGLIAKMATAGKSVRDFGRAADKAAGDHRRAFEGIGTGATRVGLAMGAAAAVAVVSFAKFDQAMSRAAAGTNATSAEMLALRKAALKAGADTQYSATQAADAITAMGKAGVSTADILSGGLQGALDLAAAGELKVGRAAEIAATAMTQFRLSGKDLPHVADLLAAGAGKAQGSVDDLANALKYVGPVAASIGVSIEETTGVLAELASQGIVSEQAGTSLRGVLSTLTSPSDKAKEALDALGITLYDGSGKFLGLANVAGQLQQSLGHMSDQQRDAALGIIFGNEQLTAAKILYQGGAKAVHDWTAAVDDSGFAARQAGLLMDNLAGDAEQLKGSLETALIQSGSGANEGLRSLTQGATSAVNAFGALPESVQRNTVVLGGVAAAALLVTGGMLKGAVAVRKMRMEMAELGVSSAKTKGALAAVGKGALALTALSFAGDLTTGLDAKVGAIGTSASQMSLELAKFAKGADLAGESARVFGSKFDGGMKGLVSFRGTQSLKSIVQDLSGMNGWWAKNQDVFGSSVEEEQIRKYGEALAELAQKDAPTAAQAFDRMAKSAGLNEKETTALLDLMPQYKQYLAGVAAEQVASGDAAKAGASATSVLKEQMVGTSTAAADLAEEIKNANDAAADWAGKALDARGATRDYQAALDNASAALKENGRTLDTNTPKGRDNAEALDAIAQAAQDQATALRENGGTQDQYRASLIKSRAELVQMAIRFGLTKKKAQEYADTVIKIPARMSTTITLSSASAFTEVGRLQRRIEALTSRRFNVRVGAAAVGGYADGGILPTVRAFADGSERHVAQIAPAGAMRLWAEPETGGEAYIPLAQSKRARSKAILVEVAKTFGMVAYADGSYGAASPYSLSDVGSRYDNAKLKPISNADYLAAVNAAKNAAQAQSKAERDLAYVRRHTPKDTRAIHDAEERLDRARRTAASARAREADAVARRNAPKGFSLGGYTKALAGTVKQTETYRRNLAAISKRGGSQLADLVEGMGADGVQLAAALANAKPAEFRRVLDLLKRLQPDAFAAAAAEPAGPVVRAFAGGGVDLPHVAQIAPAGAMRLWAEPETGGEAYIPLAASKRGTSRLVASDVVTRLGGSVAWSTARAGAASAAPSAAAASAGPGGPLVAVDKVELIRGGPVDVANEVMFQMRARG